MNVGDRRVSTPIATASYRKMKDVAAVTLGVEIARSGPLGQRVRPQVLQRTTSSNTSCGIEWWTWRDSQDM